LIVVTNEAPRDSALHEARRGGSVKAFSTSIGVRLQHCALTGAEIIAG
jgi:hypothetical protein